MRIERVVIVGAGAMGCFFAARLTEAGTAVTLIEVDAARIAALNGSGISIDDAQGVRVVSVTARRAVDMDGIVDLIVLFTKGAHTAAAAASIAHLVGPATRALTLQNGIGNAEAIAAFVPAERILVGVTDVPCDLVGPASVASHGLGHSVLGDFVGADVAGPDAVVAMLRNAGLDARHDPNVKVQIWEKIAFNSAMNALCTVSGLPVGGLDNEPGRRVIAAIRDEVVAVAHASHIMVDAAAIAAKIDNALANHVSHKPSMLQDRLAGRRTEIETINGAVVRAGVAAGIATPVNQILADLVRMIELAPIAEKHA